MGFEFGKREILTCLPIVTSVGLGIYVIWTAVRPKIGLVNPNIQKDQEKVVNNLDCADVGDKIVLCRCWRSKKFPVCDGSHNAHNKKMGDNVGPIIVTKN